MINVVVVDDNETIREGLRILINETEGYNCEQVYSNYESLFNNIDNVPVNVLLIDIGSSRFQVINAIKKIKKTLPELTVLILTLYEENDLLFDGLCAGACGYIVKRTPPEKLLQLIHDAHFGGVPMSSDIARKMIRFFQNKKQVENLNGQAMLTACENDILNKLVEGNSFKVISDSLNMNVEDIRCSLKNIYKKLHLFAEKT